MNATAIQNDVDWLAEVGFDRSGLSEEVQNACQDGGGFRSVWLFDDWAIKFDRRGRGDNQDEWNIYHSMPEEVQVLMAKPLAISGDGTVLIMERMEETLSRRADDQDTATRWADSFELILRKALFQHAGLSEEQIDVITHDNHNSNIAFDKAGNLRWIDYGVSPSDFEAFGTSGTWPTA